MISEDGSCRCDIETGIHQQPDPCGLNGKTGKMGNRLYPTGIDLHQTEIFCPVRIAMHNSDRPFFHRLN